MWGRWCNSREHLRVTVLSASVAWAALLRLGWPCCVSDLPSLILEAVFVSLLCWISCFLSSRVFFFLDYCFYIVACHKFLGLVQEWKCLIRSSLWLTITVLLTSCFHSYWGEVRSHSDFSSFVLNSLFFLFESLWNLFSWCPTIHGHLAWYGCVFTHCAGPKQALLIRQLMSFSSAKCTWIISLILSFLSLPPFLRFFCLAVRTCGLVL